MVRFEFETNKTGRDNRCFEMKWTLPALVDLGCVSAACEVFDIIPQWTVDLVPVGLADVQEVWPEPADGVLGDVGQRLAHGGTKEKGADGFVNRSNVAAERRLGFDAI